MRRERWLDLAVGVTVLCAVTVTTLVVRREIFKPNRAHAQAIPTRTVRDWRRYAAVGHATGPADAPVVITEFSDFQCPFCRELAGRLTRLRAHYPNRVRLVYRHFPLARHPQALAGARASECAARQGRFLSFHDALFANQDSLGIAPWTHYALLAGIADTSVFHACVVDSAPVPALARDTIAGHRLGVLGTPTLLINDLLIQGALPYDSLDTLVEGMLGRSRS